MCSLEFPDIETSIFQPMKDRGLVVYGVAQGGLRGGDTDEILRNFIDQTGVTFEVVRDTGDGYRMFRRAVPEASVSPFPLDVVIGPDGRLISARREFDPEALRRDIEPFLSR